jgi:hypothetical protein
MSGQQIGAAVGFVVGAFFGAPQLGAMIGGMIGGWISPTQVNGPHIGDGAAQNSAEGQPISWIIGTAGWVQGNIVQISPRREVKKTDDGKGSGTEVNTFEAHQDFCVLVCESSETRNSVIVGVLIVKIDGKISYDMRPDKNFGAENAKFLKNHTFYYGDESQLPDPTMEAITGVGNTPANRGVCTMVARDINLSQYGERIPVYEYVVIGSGTSIPETITSLVVPEYSGFVDAHWPIRDAAEKYTYEGFWDGNPIAGDTIDEIIENAANNYGVYRPPNHYLGYSAVDGTLPTSTDSYDAVRAQASVINNESVVLVYSDLLPDYFVDASISLFCPIIPYPGEFQVTERYSDWLGRVGFMETDDNVDPWSAYSFYANCTALPPTSGLHFPQIRGTDPLYIRVSRTKYAPEPVLGDPCLLGKPTLLPDSDEFVQDCDGNVYPVPTYAPASGPAVLVLREETGSLTMLGPAMLSGDPNDTEAIWEAAYDAAVASGSVEAGWVFGVDYPSFTAASNVYEATITIISLDSSAVILSDAITRIALRGGLTADDIDVTEMDQELLGYPIMQSYNGADCIRPLMTAFTSYGSEYDAKLRFHKHGEAIEIVIDPDDFIEGSETDKDTREQAIEYPRLLSVTAIDPTQDYIARPQTERRITPDVRAIGEESMQVPIVMTPDSQRQLAAIGMKVSWARAQGTRDFSLPYATNQDVYLKLVAGKPFALNGKRYLAADYGLEDGEIKIKGKYDRQSAYTSNVTATPALPPSTPPSSLGGVTIFAAMNLPRLRSKDNSPGMYIAVDGILDSWAGCLLQMSVDDEATWTTAIGSMTQSSVMGYLTAPIDDQPTSTLSVAVHGGQLNSITSERFDDGGNPCVVITNEVSELLQFQTSAEITADHYDLTDLGRGRLGTTPAPHAYGDRFVEIENVYFLPLDINLAGRVIKFRPVTFGTAPDNNAVYSVTFSPLFTGPQIVEAYTDDDGNAYTNDSGSPYYAELS